MQQPMSAKCQKRTSHGLFDELVGVPDQRVRNGKAERLSGFKIDDQFKLGCLHDWQFGRIFGHTPEQAYELSPSHCLAPEAKDRAS